MMLAPRKRGHQAVTPIIPEGSTPSERNGKDHRRSSFNTTISYAVVVALVLVAALYLLFDGSTSSTNTNEAVAAVTQSKSSAAYSGPRYLSVVIPSVVNHEGRHHRVEAIVETWGKDANALIIVHNASEEYPNALPESTWEYGATATNQQQPIDKSKFPQMLQLPSDITMADDHGFARLEYVIRHVYERHDQVGFLLLVNDHSYVIPAHVCQYLRDKSPEDDLYAGRAMRNPGTSFNTGAAGYVLSRATMKKLLEIWDKGEQCQANQGYLRSNPDLVVAICLQDILKVPVLDTRESGKYHRFHSYGVVRTVAAAVDDWYLKVHDRFENMEGFDESYRTLLNGTDCCSRETISFHYVEYKEARALHAIRQRLLSQQDSMTDAETLSFILEMWPKQDLGGYSHHLPYDKEDQLQHIVSVLRKMSTTELEVTC